MSERSYRVVGLPLLRDAAEEHVPDEGLTVQQFRDGMRRPHRDRAEDGDLWQPKHWARLPLPGQAIDALAPLHQACLWEHIRPGQASWNVVTLQAKPDNAGARPITSAGLAYEVLCKLSTTAVQEWDAAHHGFWGRASVGPPALKAAVARSL